MKPTDITGRVEGMMTLEEIAALMDFAARSPAIIVEVGAYRGLSTCALAAVARHEMFSIDPFETYTATSPAYPRGFEYRAENYDIFRANLARMGMYERVHHLRRTSLDTAALWRKPVGFLLLDANPNEIEADAAAWMKHIVSGGYLALHDRSEPAVAAVVAALDAGDEWTLVRTSNQLVIFKRTGGGLPLDVAEALKDAKGAAAKAQEAVKEAVKPAPAKRTAGAGKL